MRGRLTRDDGCAVQKTAPRDCMTFLPQISREGLGLCATPERLLALLSTSPNWGNQDGKWLRRARTVEIEST